MSANPPDVGLSHGHTRIAQRELTRPSVRFAPLPNLPNHIITSNHDSTLLLDGTIRTGKERGLRIRTVSIGDFMDVAGVYALC